MKVLRARKLADVESKATRQLLEKAGGIWFGGGRQWRFVDAYEETAALPLIHAVLQRGGVIGGSSAGASIQASAGTLRSLMGVAGSSEVWMGVSSKGRRSAGRDGPGEEFTSLWPPTRQGWAVPPR